MSSALEKRALKWIPLALTTAMVVSGCARDGFYHDRNLDYADIEPGEPLMLPDTRDVRRYGDALPIPRPDIISTSNGPAEVRPPQAMRAGGGMAAEYVERGLCRKHRVCLPVDRAGWMSYRHVTPT